MSIGRALIVAVSGFMVVFLMLCLLWFIIIMINKVTVALTKKEENTDAPSPAPAPAAVAAAPVTEVKSDAMYGGEIALYDVDEKTAACIMAIISDETKIPLSQLIFKSIKALN
ncbi:MAG: OadG family protein [Solobacterium sp.]|nr:OadG family protein [Solobacterium sp.]